MWLSEPRGSGFGGKGIQCLRRQQKCIRADNGGEYRGPFEDFCRTHGIRLDKSMPKPLSTMEWQREWTEQSLKESRACSLMPSYKNLCGLRQWELQFTWSTFLFPSVPLNGDIPERVLTRKDVSYSHADVFGCRAFVHIPKDEKSKLDDKAKQWIFLGYDYVHE